MTKQELEGIMNMINAAYPVYTRHLSDTERKAQLVLWYDIFKHDDFRLVFDTVEKHISVSPYLPTIAEIRKEIRRVTMPNNAELYDTLVSKAKMSVRSEQVLKARGTGGQADTYTTRSLAMDAFAELPDELRLFAKTPEGLQAFYREWAYNPDDARKRFESEIEYILRDMDFQKIKTGKININTLQIGGAK